MREAAADLESMMRDEIKRLEAFDLDMPAMQRRSIRKLQRASSRSPTGSCRKASAPRPKAARASGSRATGAGANPTNTAPVAAEGRLAEHGSPVPYCKRMKERYYA